MTAFLESRRRMIKRDGRTVTLRRQTQTNPPLFTTVDLLAAVSRVTPGELKDGLRQADSRAEILPDEIAAEGWPGPPRSGDSLVTPEGIIAILTAPPVYAGETLIGFRLFGRAAA